MGFHTKIMVATISLYICFMYIDYALSAKKEKSCKEITAGITKRQLSGITNCTKAMKFKNGKEKQEKMSCVIRCVLRNMGIITSEYKIDMEAIDKFVDKEFPKGEITEKALSAFRGCEESAGREINPEEELCKSYDPFARCLAISLTTAVCP